MARPAGVEPTTPWFVGLQGVFNQLILLVANARRASFRPYRSASFSRKVAQKSRTKFQNSRSARNCHYLIPQNFDPQFECSRRRLPVQVKVYWPTACYGKEPVAAVGRTGANDPFMTFVFSESGRPYRLKRTIGD